MELPVAVRLIEAGVDKTLMVQTWADLGAGNGLFTKALSAVIPSGTIYAVDKENTDVSIVSTNHSVRVKKIKRDFTEEALPIARCNGILMANSLHYVADKIAFIRQLKYSLAPGGVLLIVEYERDTANAWVPYPIRFHALQHVMKECGFAATIKIGEEPSVYGRVMIYSALIR